MKKSAVAKRRTCLSFVLVLCVTFLMAGTVSAFSWDDDEVRTINPTENSVYYRGEKIPYKFESDDTWKYYYTRPTIYIIDEGQNKVIYSRRLGPVAVNGTTTFTGHLDSSPWAPGEYCFSSMNLAYTDKSTSQRTELGNEPSSYRTFFI